jgi:hypothetical protein
VAQAAGAVYGLDTGSWGLIEGWEQRCRECNAAIWQLLELNTKAGHTGADWLQWHAHDSKV